LEQARSILTPPLLALFQRLAPSEQAHALGVLRMIQAGGPAQPALLQAALLHDIGKCLHPLQPWERALIVLARALLPGRARAWGCSGPARGWRRPFVVAEQHPGWGAELVARAGGEPLLVALVGRHQQALDGAPASLEEALLRRLQQADDSN
jgi:hypothetical protein